MINYTDLRYSFDDGDYVKNVVDDIAVVSQNSAILQIILTRLLIPKGTYPLNPNLGSELYSLSGRKSIARTEQQIKSIVLSAIKPEIDAGNVENDVIINTERVNDKIIIKSIFTLKNGTKEQINLTII